MVFEAVPDGVRPVPAAGAEPIKRRGDGTFTAAGAAAAARKRAALRKVPDFARKELEFVAEKEFKPFDDGRRDLLDAKAAEIVQLTGHAGVGVMTTLRGYSWLISFAEFWAVDAAKTGSAESADRARRFFKDASIELAKAHELARVEAQARPAPPSIIDEINREIEEQERRERGEAAE